MASSFISKDNKYGFWIRDSVFQIACRCLCSAIENESFDEKDRKWVDEFFILLDLNAKGIFHSYMHLDLDEVLIDQDRKPILSKICIQAEKYAKEKGEFIPVALLKDWYDNEKISYKWDSSFEVSRLVKVFNYLRDLIDDKIIIKVNDEINYEF